MRQAWRMFSSGARASWIAYLVEIPPAAFLGMRIPRILLQSLFFVLLAKAAGGEALARFALIGNAVQIAVFVAIASMDEVIEMEKWNDTFLYLIAAPADWLPVMLGKSVAFYGDAAFASTITFAVLSAVLHIPLPLIDLLRAAPVILLIFAAACALGWFIGAFAMPIRYGYMMCNWTGYAMIIFCGINVPLSGLPPAVQFIGSLLPVTHGLLAVRALIDGASYASVLPLIAKELLVLLVYAAAAALTFGKRLRTTRQRGTFTQV